jgi:hypothetical protein
VVSVDIITLLRTPLVWAANGIGLILVYVIGYPLGYVAALGVFVLRWFLALINKDGTAPTIQLPQRPDLEKIAREPKDAGFWGDLLVFGKWAVLIGLLALCVYLLVRYLMRKRDRQTAAEFEETSESIFNRDQFWKDVLAFWRGLFSRFKRPIPARGRAGAGRPADHADDGRTLSMREIYGALLVEGERAGTPREEAETPHEYARRLAGANGAAGPDLETITEGYVRERYGSLPTPTERVPFLNQVWRRVRGLIGSPGMREP